MLKKFLSILCVVTMISAIIPIASYGESTREYLLKETFDEKFTPVAGKENLITGGSITSVNNYRERDNNKSKNTIETDGVKDSYLKHKPLVKTSSIWYGLFLDVTKPSSAEYQVLDFDFKLGNDSNGIWIQLSSKPTSAGANNGNKLAIVQLSPTQVRFRDITNASYATLTLSDYGFAEALNKTEAWHNVKIVADTKRFVYDFVLDDVLIAADVPSGHLLDSNFKIETIYFSAQNTVAPTATTQDYIGLDDVYLYDATAAEANNIIKKGLDGLFNGNRSKYFTGQSSFRLPWAGGIGLFSTASPDDAKISYSLSSDENATIKDTHYSGTVDSTFNTASAGNTVLYLKNMPDLGEPDKSFNLNIDIKRPQSGEADQILNLVYPITLSSSAAEKNQKELDMISIWQITSDNASGVMSDIKMPLKGIYGSDITWDISNTDVIAEDGKVTRTMDDTEVTLTAQIGSGDNLKQREFTLTVKADSILRIQEDESYFDKTIFDNPVTENFTLPTTGPVFNSNIKWKSDNSAIYIDGSNAYVNRPESNEENAEVQLTAEYSLESENYTFVYLVEVAKQEEDVNSPKIMLNESFEGTYTPGSTNSNILLGGSITAYYNYRDGMGNLTRNTIESDTYKKNYFKQSLLPKCVSSNWRGVYFDLDKTPRSDYQLFSFDFKIGEKSSGLWMQICDDSSKTTGANSGLKSAMFSVSKSSVDLRNTESAYKSIPLSDYGFPKDISGKWHNIKIVLDTKRMVYDLLMDDIIIATGVPSASQLYDTEYVTKRLYFSAQGNQEGNYIGIDDISVWEISQKTANNVVKKGFDNLFSYKKMPTDLFKLPYGGLHGRYAYEGEPQVSYEVNCPDHVTLVDTHYSGAKDAEFDVSAIGETYLKFSDIPTASQEDAEFMFTIVLRRPDENAGKDETLTYTYPLRLGAFTNNECAEYAASLLDYSDLTDDDPKRLVSDLTLPTTGERNTVITWESSNEYVISVDGSVTRDDVDTQVTLTAFVRYNTYEYKKAFKFVVPRNEQQKMAQDELMFNKPDFDNVTEDFFIPSVGAKNGSKITWYSNNSSVIKIEDNMARVTRPNYSAGHDGEVRLTAVYELNFDKKEYQYDIIVKRLDSDETVLNRAYNNLTIKSICSEDPDAITKNLSLLKKLNEGVICSWKSDNTAVIDNNGNVINPIGVQGKIPVTLTATLSKGMAVPMEKVFNLQVVPFENTDQLLQKEKERLTFNKLSNERIDEVTKDLKLPNSGVYGAEITWSSADKSVVSDNGIVMRPPYGETDKIVKLTATFSYNGSTATKEFLITVLKNDGYEVVFGTDCENDSIIGGTPKFTGIGKSRLEQLDRGSFAVEYDSEDDSNKVVKFTRNGDQKFVCILTFLTQYGNQNFETDELSVKSKLFIPEDTENTVKFAGNAYLESTGGMNEIFPIEFSKDGKIAFMQVVNGAEKRVYTKDIMYPRGKWFEIEVRANTYTKLYDLYIDGEKITRNGNIVDEDKKAYDSSAGIPFCYATDPDMSSNFYAVRFWHVAGVVTKNQNLYIDDFYVTRKIQFGTELTNAINQFHIQFMSNNNIDSVYKNLTIPSIDIPGVSVNVASENESIVKNDGTVFFNKNEQETTLNVTFTDFNKNTAFKSYKLNIVSSENELYKEHANNGDNSLKDITKIVDSFEKMNLNMITQNLNFVKKGEYGSEISYSSSDTSVLTNDGVVFRKDRDKTVNLVITADYNGNVQQREITLIIKAAAKESSSSGGGVSVGGSATTVIPTGAGNYTNAAKKVFNDVDETFWAYKEIAMLKEKNIVSGVGNNMFNANASVKREEFIKMLVSVLDIDDSNVDVVFDDVDTSSWYYSSVKVAVNSGIVSGYGDGKFGIGAYITREDLAVAIYNAVKDNLNTEGYSEAFSDETNISDYAIEAVYELRKNNLMSGRENNCFAPKAYVTRAETAVMIARIINFLSECNVG